MHDPSTVAFEIKSPFWVYKPWPDGINYWECMDDKDKIGRSELSRDGYRNTLVTIWHIDPKKDGSDDSCRWTYPNLTKWQKVRLKSLAWNESHYPRYLTCHKKNWEGSRVKAEHLYRSLVLNICDFAEIPITFDEAAKYASNHINFPDCIDPANIFCFVPGYTTNFKKDDPEHREEYFYGVLCSIACDILRIRRPWYKHSRWHFWHWSFQIHAWEALRRRLLDRCEVCGKPFINESPHSFNWDNPKRRWFKGTPGLYHANCTRRSEAYVPQVAMQAPAPEEK